MDEPTVQPVHSETLGRDHTDQEMLYVPKSVEFGSGHVLIMACRIPFEDDVPLMSLVFPNSDGIAVRLNYIEGRNHREVCVARWRLYRTLGFVLAFSMRSQFRSSHMYSYLDNRGRLDDMKVVVSDKALERLRRCIGGKRELNLGYTKLLLNDTANLDPQPQNEEVWITE